MRRRPGRRPARDDEDLEEDPEEDEEPSGPPRARGGRHARPSVRPWSPSGKDRDAQADEDDEPHGWLGFLHRPKRPVYFRARDSLYFEPLVALSILVLLLVSLFAYTQNWPPVYVIESDSMQHGDTDNLGLINTGDLVLAQKIPRDQVVPYVVGLQTGYTTYGEYGDVLLYLPNGVSGTPVIHRALLFLEANPNGTYNAPSLAGLSCGSMAGAFYSVSSTPNHCGTVGISGTLTLHGVGWRSVDVTLALDTLGRASGFVTMGDNNYVPGTSPETGLTDQSVGISSLVQPGWIVGVARGMLPWFGAMKLLLAGTASQVPTESWEFLGLTLVGIVLLAMGIHYLFRAEGIEDPRRKLEEEEEDEDGDDDGEEDDEDNVRSSGRRRWLHPIRSWRASDEEDTEGSTSSSKRGRDGERRRTTLPWGGRPRPTVGRKPPTKGHRRTDSSDDDL